MPIRRMAGKQETREAEDTFGESAPTDPTTGITQTPTTSRSSTALPSPASSTAPDFNPDPTFDVCAQRPTRGNVRLHRHIRTERRRAGTKVTVPMIAMPECKNTQYKFLLRKSPYRPGFTTLQQYSNSDTFEWDTAGHVIIATNSGLDIYQLKP